MSDVLKGLQPLRSVEAEVEQDKLLVQGIKVLI